jgi:superfamily II DNA/RNA helicase
LFVLHVDQWLCQDGRQTGAVLHLPQGATCAPLAVVLAPTRELVQQVGHVARGMHKELGVAVACVYGGVDKEGQRRMLTPEVWRPAEMPTLVIYAPFWLMSESFFYKIIITKDG